jgi:hypothetical protein
VSRTLKGDRTLEFTIALTAAGGGRCCTALGSR